jgi:hemoglobin-like flavoprotein
MSPRQIALVRSSWRHVGPRREALARCFYARLFADTPALRELFPDDLSAQSAKLAATLNVVVEHLDDLQPLGDTLRKLGEVHRDRWAVTAGQYDLVREALLWALAKELGAEFDAERHEAWRDAYEAVAAPMRAKARGP